MAAVETEELRVLLVEDSENDAALIAHELVRGGLEASMERVDTAQAMRAALDRQEWDVIISDHAMPHFSGLGALSLVLERRLDLPFIYVSGTIGEETAVEAMKAGAHDYIMKNSLKRLVPAIRRELREATIRRERRRAGADLAVKVEELARSNADLERFAYVASHDLQEPLRMVASFTQLLAERYRGKLDKDADTFIGFVVEGSRRMQDMLRGLLEYSRTGGPRSELADTDAGEVLEHALANLRMAIEERGATITSDSLPVVKADPVQLLQVLQNLVENALKFHGTEPTRIHIRAERQPDAWQFMVRDNGIGIAPESVERVFDIFQTLHSREDYPGMGVGLSICKRLVERNGGRIWVESKPGEGSTFCFTVRTEQAKNDAVQFQKSDLLS